MLSQKIAWAMRTAGMAILMVVAATFLSYAQVHHFDGKKYEQIDGRWNMHMTDGRTIEIIPDRLVVKAKDGVSFSDFADLGLAGTEGVRRISRRYLNGYYVLELPKEANPILLAQKLMDSNMFVHVHFESYGKRCWEPRDQYYSQQWGLRKIRAPKAWDFTTGSSSVIVAIIDSGTDYDHKDLDGNIWNNLYEVPGNQFDDDLNGFVDDIVGWDFSGDDNDPEDNYGHGTCVAGIAAAQTNNYESGQYRGIAGVAGGFSLSVPGCKLMDLKDGEDNPVPSLTAQCIEYAANNGARVINISTGYSDVYPDIEDAIDLAVDTYECVVVASSGNSWQNMGVRFPASYSKTIAVGCTDTIDARAYFSCYGSELDLVAPGWKYRLGLLGTIYTTDIEGSGGYSSGDYNDNFGQTSAAAPFVSGTAALVLSYWPSLTYEQVRDCLQSSAADQVGLPEEDTPGWDQYHGFGRLDAFGAVACASAYKNNLLVPDNYSTIQAAINAATSGKIVFVKPGTYSEKITMKNGVRVVGAGSSNTTIDATGFSDYAVTFNNITTEARIEGFTIKRQAPNYGAIQVLSSKAWIENCKIQTQTLTVNYGIRCISSPYAVIMNNVITQNGYGIYLYNCAATPTIKYNDISEVTSVGVWCACQSDPVMRLGSTVVDNNDIIGGGWAIFCNDRSEPQLGSSDSYKGNNAIVGSNYDFWAQSDCDHVWAIRNWWGETPPITSQIVHNKGSQYMHYDPWLDNNPKTVRDGDAEWYTKNGRFLFEEGKYDEAISCLRFVIDKYPESEAASHALDHLSSCYQAMGEKSELLDYLTNTASRCAGTFLEGAAISLTISSNLERGQFDVAIAKCQDLVKRFADTDIGRNILFLEGMISKYYLEDDAKACEAFEAFLSKYPEDPMAVHARFEIGTPISATKSEPTTPEGFQLAQNCPNPFNPETEIAFTLPEVANVSLIVYNILGQVVDVLVNSDMQAGYHTVSWNSQNAASGVYFYRLVAGNYAETKRMLLLK